MKKNVVRVLALVLVALMCLSLVPLAAHAEEMCPHSFVPVTVEPTCWENGYVQLQCQLCGEWGQVIDASTPPTGIHSFMNVEDEQYLILKGDCEHAYQYWKSCSVCQQSAEEAYANALDELYEDLNNRKNSGEQADWEQIVKDRVLLLDEKYKFSYGGEGHHYIHVDHQEATCTSDGWKEYSYCDVCGEYFNYEVIPAKGHRWGEYTQTKAPTCTEAGEKVRVCEVCDEKDVVVLPALGHAWGEFKVTKEATCTEDGSRERVCSVCNEKEIQVIPAAHKFGEYVVTLEPTCFVDGSRERVCTVCGHKEVEAIPAAHTYGEFTVTQEPTCYSTGAKTATCTVCGEEHTEWIDMVPHKYENGECVFCHEAMPEGYVAPSEDRTEITETAGSETETTDNQTAEPETTDNQTAEPETFGTENETTAPEQQGAEPAAEAAPVNTVTITFDGNGATGGSMEPQAFAEGSVQALSANAFTRDGYLFLGWDVAADGSAMGEDRFLDGEAVEVNSDVMLFAQWREINADVETQQTEASAETVSSFENVLNAQGLTEIDPSAMVVQNVTPLDENGEKMSNEEVAARGGVIFDMPLPDNYVPGDEIGVYHQNSETGEWERVTTYTVQDDKVIICLKHFSPVAVVNMSNANNAMLGAGGQVSVKLDPNGGTGETMGPITGEEGTNVTLPYENSFTYSRTGYNFAGWNTQADGKGSAYGDVNNPYGATYTIHKGETLYAQWAPIVKVVYNANGGTITVDQKELTKEYSKGQIFTICGKSDFGLSRKDEGKNRDYNFTGWNLNADGTKDDETHTEPGTTYLNANNVTLYAEWAAPVTVKYLANGGSGYMADDTTHYVGDSITLAPNVYTHNIGYKFAEWNEAADGTGKAYEDKAKNVELTGDLTLYAQWAIPVYVTFDANGGTGAAMENQTVPADYPTKLNKNTYEKEGYTFIGWSVKDKDGKPGSTVKYLDEETVYLDAVGTLNLAAMWEQTTFTVTYKSDDGTVEYGTAPVVKGGEAQMPDATIITGGEPADEVLIGWSKTKNSATAEYKPGAYVKISEDTPLYAVLMPAVTITFKANNGTDSEYTQKIPLGITTKLDPFQSMGFSYTDHHFTNWNTLESPTTTDKGNSYDDRANMTASEDKVLYAQWGSGEAPSAPVEDTHYTVTPLVNYNNGDLAEYGHEGKITDITDIPMEYYNNNQWNDRTKGSSLSVKAPLSIEFRFKATTSPEKPASASKDIEVKSYISKAGDPRTVAEMAQYLYDVSLYEVDRSGKETLADPQNIGEEVYFLLKYPSGISQNSHLLTLTHVPDNKQIEIEQLPNGILGSAESFSDFRLEVEDRLHGNVTLSNYTPKMGDTITAKVTDHNCVGSLEYLWMRDEEVIGDWTTSNRHTVEADDLEHQISCLVRSKNSTPKGTLESDKTAAPSITMVENTSYDSEYIAYFDGVTTGMQYSLDGGTSWVDVPGAGTLSGTRLYVKQPGQYTFRSKGETETKYWDVFDTIEKWYLVTYTVSNSDGASGTVTVKNGSTTLGSNGNNNTTTIYEDTAKTKPIIQPYGSNGWKVKAGASTNMTITARPASGSYGHWSLNNSGYSNFNSEITISVSPVTKHEAYNFIFNKSSSSPRTGDMSNLGLWSALCLVSFVGVTGILTSARKRKNRG